jgi:hypothetical protein
MDATRAPFADDSGPTEEEWAAAARRVSPPADPLRSIVPGFIGEGLTLLVGRPKTGKTWLALELAGAVARGGQALGQVFCDQGPVLYLDDENGQRRVDARVDTLFPPGSYWRGRDSREVRWAPERSLDGDFIRTVLDPWFRACRPGRLVVIDAPGRIGPATTLASLDERRQRERELIALRRWATKKGTAVLVLCARGSAAETERLLGIADAALFLERYGGGGTLAVLSRDAPPRKVALAFDDGRWTIAGDAEEVMRSQQRTDIIAALQVGGTLGPAEIAGALGEPAVNVRRMLFRMLRAGEVARVGYGLYRLPAPESHEIAISPVAPVTLGRKPRQPKSLKCDQPDENGGHTRSHPVTVGHIRRDVSPRIAHVPAPALTGSTRRCRIRG